VKKVSLQDIASQLNVSKSLVSFVLNGQGDEMGIRTSTQNRVIEKARELNYKPNFIARGLRIGKSNTIGLIVADISNNFYARIAKQVECVATRNNYHLIFCSSDEDPQKEIELIEMLRERQVDGLILSTTQKETGYFTQLKKEKFPFVLIDRQLAKLRTNYVGVENYNGAFRATKQLISNGYRRIALLKISPGYLSTVKEREQGYRDAMKANGIRVMNSWVREIGFKQVHNQVNHTLEELLNPSPSVDALFTVNNNIAVACLEYLRECHIRIPDDLALISFDDIDLFMLSQPDVSAIAQPLMEIGEIAVNMLLEEIKGKCNRIPQRKILPVVFIPRSSCGTGRATVVQVPEKVGHYADCEN
jgi:LacI family transcriptional regulator